MSIVPALDLRPANESGHHPNDPGAPQIGPPSSIEAEQMVLGSVMYDNDAFHLIEGLEAGHFYEPFHQRLWAWLADKIGKGVLAEPIMAGQYFERDEAFQELCGVRYLADLVDRAPPAANAPEYARHIVDLSLRRDLLKLAGELFSNATEAVRAEDAIGLAEAGLLAMQTGGRRLEMISAGMASARVLAELDAPAESVIGTYTGFAPLDEELGPLIPGDLILVAGRSSMGKSAMGECIGLNIARTGRGVIQINVEMTPEAMAQRHLTDLCQEMYGARGPEYRDIRRRRIHPDQRAMLQRAHGILDSLPIVMQRRPGIKFSQLRSLVRRQAAQWARAGIPLGALIVDHMGRVRPDERVRDLHEAQAVISAASKELADEIGCPFFALVQLNRETEKRDDKRPQLSDIRQSGTWEEDADYVIGCYREAYYAHRQPEPKKEMEIAEWLRAKNSRSVEAIILKARAGACLTVKLWGDVARNAIRGQAPEGDLF